jgi:hypothetical protein
MIPETERASDEEESGTKTYKLDFEKKRIDGMIDGREALEQAIELALMTPRYEYAIYSHSYGTDWSGVIGESYLKAMAGAKSAIEDSLMCDDRILSVDDFEFEKKKNGMKISFKVNSVYGDIDAEKEVGLSE